MVGLLGAIDVLARGDIMHTGSDSQNGSHGTGLAAVTGLVCDAIETVCCFLIGFFIAAIVVITMLSVWYRYVLNDPLSWTEQISGVLFVWITFLGSAVLYRRVLHIAIDMLVVQFPQRIQTFFYWVNEALMFSLALLMIWFGTRHAWLNLGQTFGALEITPSWFYAAPPLSGLMMVVFAFEKILNPKKRQPQGELHL